MKPMGIVRVKGENKNILELYTFGDGCRRNFITEYYLEDFFKEPTPVYGVLQVTEGVALVHGENQEVFYIGGGALTRAEADALKEICSKLSK